MISVQFPQVYALIRDVFHGGLYPLKFIADQKIKLIIKAPKEMLLAAKLRKEFKIYVSPIKESNKEAIALISAFYDTDVDPLTITTPLFDEALTSDFQEMLLSDGVDIYFFDLNNVEFFGYQAIFECKETVKAMIAEAVFPPISADAAKSIIAQMTDWYIHQNVQDDANAITVKLGKPLFPDDFFIIDARPSSAHYISEG